MPEVCVFRLRQSKQDWKQRGPHKGTASRAELTRLKLASLLVQGWTLSQKCRLMRGHWPPREPGLPYRFHPPRTPIEDRVASTQWPLRMLRKSGHQLVIRSTSPPALEIPIGHTGQSQGLNVSPVAPLNGVSKHEHGNLADPSTSPQLGSKHATEITKTESRNCLEMPFNDNGESPGRITLAD